MLKKEKKLVLGLEIDLEEPDCKLFSDKADEIAKKFDKGINAKGAKNNKRTQIRGFYDEIVNWNDKIKLDDDAFHKFHPMINMILAKVAYSFGRDLISVDVVTFFRNSLDQINSAKSLNNFRLLFEAISGFYIIYRPKSND